MTHLCLTSSSFLTSFPPLTTTKPSNSLVRLRQKTTLLPILRCSASLDSDNGSGSAQPKTITKPQAPKLPSSLGTDNGGGSATIETAAETEIAVLSGSEDDAINPVNSNVVVEHIVLFKMKEPGFTSYNEEIMIEAFRSLKCLDGADRNYLKAGLIPENGQSGDYKFTIFLHSRHSSEDAVNQYMGHKLKAAFSALYTEPFYEDYIIIDYLHDNGAIEHTNPAPGEKLRAVFFRLKNSWEGSNQHEFNAILDEHLSATRTSGKTFVGRTYREARKGYGYASLTVIANEDSLPTAIQLADTLNDKLKHMVEENGVFVVDYVVEE